MCWKIINGKWGVRRQKWGEIYSYCTSRIRYTHGYCDNNTSFPVNVSWAWTKLPCTPLISCRLLLVAMTTTSTISCEWVLNVGQQWGKHLFQWWDHPDCCVTVPSGGWWWQFEAFCVLRDWVRVPKCAVCVMKRLECVHVSMWVPDIEISRPTSNVVRFVGNVSH